MIKRSTEQWQNLFKQHNESGLSAAQFCHDNELCPKYFAKGKKDLGWQTQNSVKPALVKLIKPTLNSSVNRLTLQCGEVTLSVNDAVSPQWLAQLMKALA